MSARTVEDRWGAMNPGQRLVWSYMLRRDRSDPDHLEAWLDILRASRTLMDDEGEHRFAFLRSWGEEEAEPVIAGEVQVHILQAIEQWGPMVPPAALEGYGDSLEAFRARTDLTYVLTERRKDLDSDGPALVVSLATDQHGWARDVLWIGSYAATRDEILESGDQGAVQALREWDALNVTYAARIHAADRSEETWDQMVLEVAAIREYGSEAAFKMATGTGLTG